MSAIATNLEPPYYAVVFSNQAVTNPPDSSYSEMAKRMNELAAQQPGYLGIESVRDNDGFAITVSYWKDIGSIKNWKQVAEHLTAQQKGQNEWYAEYRVRICRVEREYGWERP
jgi:heme-degrading monooxygenase HmoA